MQEIQFCISVFCASGNGWWNGGNNRFIFPVVPRGCLYQSNATNQLIIDSVSKWKECVLWCLDGLMRRALICSIVLRCLSEGWETLEKTWKIIGDSFSLTSKFVSALLILTNVLHALMLLPGGDGNDDKGAKLKGWVERSLLFIIMWNAVKFAGRECYWWYLSRKLHDSHLAASG